MGKFKPFKNEDIMQMLSVYYIIDGLAPSPQLVQKMQDQECQPTMAMAKTGLQLLLVLDGNRAPIFPALLHHPGSPHDGTSEDAVPKLQG